MKKVSLLSCYLLLFSLFVHSQSLSERIRLNQVGFYPTGQKMAIVLTDQVSTFYIKSADRSITYFTGTLSEPKFWSYSDETVAVADFSSMTTKGSYVVEIPEIGYSHSFEIKDNIHADLMKSSVKFYYHARASSPILAEHAGIYARPMGHPDTEVEVHSSVTSDCYAVGSTISSPGGWYDAGGYRKIIANANITLVTLMMAYEYYSCQLEGLDTNIPESSNNLPDVLDEIIWELEWYFTMQDPCDGGVFYKITDGDVWMGPHMPHNDPHEKRYLYEKGAPVTYGFAAVMAHAYTVFKKFPETQNLANRCLTAAQRAWNWAEQNPTVPTPHDDSITDDMIWAAAEMFIATQQEHYYQKFKTNWDANYGDCSDCYNCDCYNIPDWKTTGTLGLYALNYHRNNLPSIVDANWLESRILSLANIYSHNASSISPYKVPSGFYWWHFDWGHNSHVANQGMALLQAYEINKDPKYLQAANSAMDYLLGRNATTYSFVTGFGDKTPMDPHHQPSKMDGIPEPVPGMLVGGPQCISAWYDYDDCYNYYDATFPDDPVPPLDNCQDAKHYLDNFCTYTTNEMDVNWNAPLFFLSAGLEQAFANCSCPTVGTACDDNNPDTVDDKEDGNCNCVGTVVVIPDAIINQTNIPMVIDGAREGDWNKANRYDINNGIVNPTTTTDLSGYWLAVYDADYLYVYIEVTDDNVTTNDSGHLPFKDDGVEIYIDANNSKGTTYDAQDMQLVFRSNDNSTYAYQAQGQSSISGVLVAQQNNANGYQIEIKIPWSVVGLPTTAKEGVLLGMDVHINDDDDGGDRDHKMAWFANQDDSWDNPSTFGQAQLGGITTSLAVEYLPLQATVHTDYVELNWQSTTVEQLKHFTIQRSDNGQNFKAIQQISISQQSNRFSYKDSTAEAIPYLYRIKQTQTNGTVLYSNMAAVNPINVVTPFQIAVQPNPFYEGFQIQIIEDTKQKEFQFDLFDAYGKQLFQRNRTVQNGQYINLSVLPAGVYWIRVYSNESEVVKRVLKY